MARDDDYDDRDDRDDDRPRRRRRDDDDRPRRRRDDDDRPPAKKGGTGVVLLIVGLVVGIPLLTCGGIGVWLYFKVRQVATDIGGTFQADIAAIAFLNTLKNGDLDGAYMSTSANFKTTTSKEQFEKLVKANPVLTTSHKHTQNGFPSPTGTAPNRRVTLTFTVSYDASGIALGEQLDDLSRMNAEARNTGAKPVPPPTIPKTPSTAPTPKGTTCTITLAEQPDGTWKVDGFTVP